jgi:hypothetical protein
VSSVFPNSGTVHYSKKSISYVKTVRINTIAMTDIKFGLMFFSVYHHMIFIVFHYLNI